MRHRTTIIMRKKYTAKGMGVPTLIFFFISFVAIVYGTLKNSETFISIKNATPYVIGVIMGIIIFSIYLSEKRNRRNINK